jgi:glycosyltransferase involved in cell wall biosynthesis
VQGRVLVISYDFPPSLEVGAHACSQLIRYLPLYGWEPIVLTVQERYITNLGEAEARAFPGTVIRTGMIPHPLMLWSRMRPRTNGPSFDGMELERPIAELGRMRRWMLSLLKVPDDLSGWIVPAVRAGLRGIREHGVTRLISSGPHWSNHLVGLCLTTMTKLPWIAHFRDPWIGIPQWKPVSALSTTIEEKLEGTVVNRAAAVVCVTDAHAQMVRQRYPNLPSGKITTITNGFDEAEWQAIGEDPEAESVHDRAFVLMYAGSFYQARNPRTVFRALRRLIEAGEIDEAGVRVDLVGWCDVAEGQRVRDVAVACGVDRHVRFTGPLSRAETLRRMTRADLLLLLAEAQPFQVPGKTYEYLRAGRPILALTREGAVADLLRPIEGACVVDPDDETGIAEAIRERYQRGRTRYSRSGPDGVAAFDRRVLAGRLAEVLDGAGEGWRGRGSG